MNKKGEERILSFWWIFVFVIIALFIMIGTITYYSETIDVRIIEADVLSNKIASCLSGDIDLAFSDNFEIYNYCKLKNSEINGKTDYYISLTLYLIDSCEIENGVKCENYEKRKFFGNDWQEYCDLQKENGIQRKLPQCSEKYIYVVNKSQEKILKINTASNQKSGEIWKS